VYFPAVAPPLAKTGDGSTANKDPPAATTAAFWKRALRLVTSGRFTPLHAWAVPVVRIQSEILFRNFIFEIIE
jgi:hypothetical protein